MLVALGAACFCLGALALAHETTDDVDIRTKTIVDSLP
jgi:hypothetical protein